MKKQQPSLDSVRKANAARKISARQAITLMGGHNAFPGLRDGYPDGAI